MGRTGGIYVKAEDILDIIDGYKGGDYGVSTQHELGARMLGLAKLFFKQKAIILTDAKGVCRCIQLLTGLVGKTMNKQS